MKRLLSLLGLQEKSFALDTELRNFLNEDYKVNYNMALHHTLISKSCRFALINRSNNLEFGENLSSFVVKTVDTGRDIIVKNTTKKTFSFSLEEYKWMKDKKAICVFLQTRKVDGEYLVNIVKNQRTDDFYDNLIPSQYGRDGDMIEDYSYLTHREKSEKCGSFYLSANKRSRDYI